MQTTAWLGNCCDRINEPVSNTGAFTIEKLFACGGGVEFLITRVAYSFRVVAAAYISSSPLHNSRQDENKKRGNHLQEKYDYE